MDRVRYRQCVLHHASRTEQACVAWIRSCEGGVDFARLGFPASGFSGSCWSMLERSIRLEWDGPILRWVPLGGGVKVCKMKQDAGLPAIGLQMALS